jgi:hypothetical protein
MLVDLDLGVDFRGLLMFNSASLACTLAITMSIVPSILIDFGLLCLKRSSLRAANSSIRSNLHKLYTQLQLKQTIFLLLTFAAFRNIGNMVIANAVQAVYLSFSNHLYIW